MTTDKIKLKSLLKKTQNALQQDIIDYYLDCDNIKGHLQDVCHHGCISGSVSHLIYYKDTNEYYQKFKTEIWDLLQEDSENLGFNNIMSFIASLNGCNNVDSEEQLLNLLSWYAFESVSNWILSELEEN
jgi:hypothetical protein